MSSVPQNYLQSVRDQYEDFPYPPFDPEQELSTKVVPMFDQLDLVNFYCFGGRQDFSKGFRVLLAGNGTGNTTIYFANALRDTNAEIVYLDISANSMAIAKRRAEKRGLKNIQWVHRSLLDLPQMKELGEFDYINCGGVLHHLADPDAGLNALRCVLKEDGAMGIMVYGKYGRSGVYAVQETMRLLSKNTPNKAEQVELCKKLLPHLPKGHSWHHLKHHFEGALRVHGDGEMFDLFLHSQDRAYTVPEIYAWVKRCDLEFLNFMYMDGLARAIYDPSMFITDPDLRALAAALPPQEQQALAEVLYGEMKLHFFYTAKHKKLPPDVSDQNTIPFFSHIIGYSDAKLEILNQIEASGGAPAVKISNSQKSAKVMLQKTANVLDLLRLIDGKRTVCEILNQANEVLGVPKEVLKNEFEYLYTTLHHLDWLLLKY